MAAPEAPTSEPTFDKAPPKAIAIEVIVPPHKRPYGSSIYKVGLDTHDTVNPPFRLPLIYKYRAPIFSRVLG